VKLARQIFSVLFVRWISIWFGFFAGILIARTLGPEGKGTLTLIASVLALITVIFSFGMTEATAYFYKQKQHTEGELVGAVVLLWMVLISFITLLYALVGQDLVSFRPLWVWLSIATLPSLVLSPLIHVVWVVGERTRLVSWMGIGSQLLLFALISVCVLFFKLGITGVLIANLAAQTFCLVLIFAWLSRIGNEGRLRLDPQLTVKLLKNGFGPFMNSLASNVFKRGETVLLAVLLPLSSIGQYGIAMGIYDVLNDLPRSAVWPLMGHMSGLTPAEQIQTTLRKGRLQLTAMLFPVAALGLVSPFLLPLIYGDAFAPSGVFLAWVVVGAWFRTIHLIVYSYFATLGRTGAVLPSMILAAVVNLGLDLILAPVYGLKGVAIANVAAEILAASSSLFIFIRQTKMRISDLLPPTLSDLRELRGIFKILSS
jgi:O-antigen/teichoic acid export membrane protein